MTLLRAQDLELSFGSRTIFEGLTLTIEEGERVGLIGVNGSGKSSLMKLLAGAVQREGGTVQVRRGARITYLPQEPEFPEGATIESELTVATLELRTAISEHESLAKQLETLEGDAQTKALERLGVLADQVDRLGGWDTTHVARTLLDKLRVDGWERPISELSGGQRKRVALARVLLERPDLLLLDEPTNHLDADTVAWLEEALDELPGALLLVTHDRYFLDSLVEKIFEIQPGGGITAYPGNYQQYLEQKLVAEEQSEVSEHKRQRWIAQEVAWLRKGVEARRTKSKARIERAQKLLSERGFQRPKVADLQITAAPRLGGTIAEMKKVSKRFGELQVLDRVDFQLLDKERLGLVGPNGVGKTTFVRTLLGELPADAGEVVLGKRTEVAYFDQRREQLDPEQTVYEAAWGEEWVEVGGKRVHLRDYLDDLLFPVPMQRMRVGALSGGERNRLLLARLFLQKANVLVLDEPTNDLDLVTLNILERLLTGFVGSVVLVTHDRYFLDKVATSILAFEGKGKVVRHAGNFAMYRRLSAQKAAQDAAAAKAPAPSRPTTAASTPAPAPAAAPKKAGKLSFKEQRELDGMEATIDAAESRKTLIETELADPTLFTRDGKRAMALHAELEAKSAEVVTLWARWQVLQDKAAGS